MTPRTCIELLRALHGHCDGVTEFRTFTPGESGPPSGRAFLKSEDLNSLTFFIGSHLREHAYFGVATRRDGSKGTLENCAELSALFVDLDYKQTPEDDARRRMAECPFAPSAVVGSGGGLHGYWLLQEPLQLQDPTDCALAGTLLRRLAHFLCADLAAAEPARVLRLPGTQNFKYDPPRHVVVELLEPARRYHASEFDELLPAEPVESRGPGALFVAPEKILQGQRNGTLFKAARSLKAKRYARETIRAALHAENRAKCDPPVPDEEVERIVENAWSQPDREPFTQNSRAVSHHHAAVKDTSTATPPREESATTERGHLVDEVYMFLGRFVVYPSEAAHVAHTLWVGHTHLMDSWESTPRLSFLSPEPASGKTRALEVTETVVPRPVESVNATSAYLFRKVSDHKGLPTILYDEIDTLFGPKAQEHEEVRGLINAGHRRGASAGRCVVKGKLIETEELPAFCAVALAGLGNLPDTILTRSVIIKMRRRAPGESVEPYRRRLHAPEGHRLRDRLAHWALAVAPTLTLDPTMPEWITDRSADVWEALLSVADAIGGDWPARARVAAVSLVSDAMAATPSLGLRLLSDLKSIFGDRDAMWTTEILLALIDLEEAPWGDLKGKPLDARRLAHILKPYGVLSKQVRIGEKGHKGYTKESLWDAWLRYLPVKSECGVGLPAIASETSETSDT